MLRSLNKGWIKAALVLDDKGHLIRVVRNSATSHYSGLEVDNQQRPCLAWSYLMEMRCKLQSWSAVSIMFNTALAVQVFQLDGSKRNSPRKSVAPPVASSFETQLINNTLVWTTTNGARSCCHRYW
jgi:hypothetical protein